MSEAYLEIANVEKLEKEPTNVRDRLLIRSLFHLGCRVSEALAITVEDIDFRHGTIRIEHLKSRISLNCPICKARLGKSHAFCPKCGLKIASVITKEQEHRRMRTLPVDEDTLSMLKEYIKRGGPVRSGNRILIFGISRHRAWQIVKECAERAGLPKLLNPETGRVHNVSPHRLRDAFATYAIKLNDSGDGLRLLQEHLGHASFDTTAKYRKISGSEHRDWYKNLWRNEVNSDHDET
jgi:integrase/recombinase XerD